MWIFTEHGFFSVTQTPDRSDLIQIRARSRKHLENLKRAFAVLERSKIIMTPDADYRFRVVCKRWRWEKLAEDLSKTINYSNFKGRVMSAGWAREMIGQLHDIWGIMHTFQVKLFGRVDPMEGEPVLFFDARDREGLFDESEEPGVAPAKKERQPRAKKA